MSDNNYPKYPYFKVEETKKEKIITFPPQHQDTQPGIESKMEPKPIFEDPSYQPSRKLKGKVLLITGGDSGIGRAVSVLFAKEGANISIVYYDETVDAMETKKQVEKYGVYCLLIAGDIKDEHFCYSAVNQTILTFGKIDILINNAAMQFPKNSILEISNEQLELTFKTNIFSFFYFIKASLPHMKAGSSIINTSSVTAYAGNKTLIDYSATKGAVTTLTRSLALNLVDQDIRVNQVAPGPIWTPLIVSSFDEEKVKTFGATTPMKRAGQPFEVAYAYLYFASDESRYVTGECIHINGGMMVTS